MNHYIKFYLNKNEKQVNLLCLYSIKSPSCNFFNIIFIQIIDLKYTDSLHFSSYNIFYILSTICFIRLSNDLADREDNLNSSFESLIVIVIIHFFF